MDRETVKVYVRDGDSIPRRGTDGEWYDEETRTLSLRPPAKIPQREWLNRGFAIDGNSVTFSVTARVDGAGNPMTLMDALLVEERDLVEWLDKLGYDVEFA